MRSIAMDPKRGLQHKLQRRAAHLRNARLPLSSVAAHTKLKPRTKMSIYKDLHAAKRIGTVYGTLAKTVQVGGQSIEYLCPFAMLRHITEVATPFGDVLADFLASSRGSSALAASSRGSSSLAASSRDGSSLVASSRDGSSLAASTRDGRIVLNFDEVTPGNQLRPDPARKYQAIYWSFLELPNYMRVRRSSMGWFPLTYISASMMQAANVNMSQIVAQLIKVIWRRCASKGRQVQ